MSASSSRTSSGEPPGARRPGPRPARPGTARRSAATSAAKSASAVVEGGDHAAGSTTGRRPATQPVAVEVSPTTARRRRLLDRVGDRPHADHDGVAGRPRRATQAARKTGGVIGHSASCSTNGSPASTSAAHAVPRSTSVTPASPSAQAAQATSGLAVDQRERQRAAAVLHHRPERWPGSGRVGRRHGGDRTGRRHRRMTQAPAHPECDGALGETRLVSAIRRRGPRRGWPRPCPRWCARPGPARRRGSGAPWPASASRRPTGRGHARGATGRGRPRPPS